MVTTELSGSSDTQPPARDTAVLAPRTVCSEELFQGRNELLIEHHGEIYRLRLTKTGKLILNK